MSKYKHTEEELRKAVTENFSIASVLKSLGVVAAGGNYQTFKKRIKNLQLDTSHFTGQGHLKGKTHGYNKRPLSEILVKDKFENTYGLKHRLLKESLKEALCECCNLSSWQNRAIPLELHHKDGDRTNNTLINLSLLCPNCHALTDNYRGKNKNKGKRDKGKFTKIREPLVERNCVSCKKSFMPKKKDVKFCSGNCANKYHGKVRIGNVPTKITWCDSLVLDEMVKTLGFLETGRRLGVSDNAVRKRLRIHKS